MAGIKGTPLKYEPFGGFGAETAHRQSMAAGSDELLRALWREYPERLRYLFGKGLGSGRP